MTEFNLTDTFTIDDAAKVHKTSLGFLVATPRVARTGIQLYRGSEVGKPDMPVVRVYRPADAVFNADSLKTYPGKPMTDDHPPVLVDAKNWKQYSRGTSGDEVLRDGEFVRVPMMLQDAALIEKFDAGKAELSVGYTCQIAFQDGKTETGEAYDAIQSNIKVNHIAVVDEARGGKQLKIGDATGVAVDMSALAEMLNAITAGKVNTKDNLPITDANGHDLAGASKNSSYRFMKDGTVYTHGIPAARALAMVAKDGDMVSALDALLSFTNGDAKPAITKPEKKTMNDVTRTLIVDGLSVTVADRDAQIIQRAMDGFEAFKKKTAEELAAEKAKNGMKDEAAVKATTDLATANATIADLTKKLADSAVTPAMLDAAITTRANVFAKAKALFPDVITDGKSVDDVMKAVVTRHVGDASAAWPADHVKISFDSITAAIKLDAQDSTSRTMSDAFAVPAGTLPAGSTINDSAKFHADRAVNLQDAWKHPNGVPARTN